MARHRRQEFIRFLNVIEREVPAGKVIHVILDNYAAHKHPKPPLIFEMRLFFELVISRAPPPS